MMTFQKVMYKKLNTMPIIHTKIQNRLKSILIVLNNCKQNSKISSALADDYDKDEESEPEIKEPASKIVTTEDEIESFYIIRGLLAGIVPVEDIVHRDTESYFGILYKDNNRKPICRLNLDARNKQLLIPDANKKFERIYIDSLNDLYKYKNRLIEVVKRYM